MKVSDASRIDRNFFSFSRAFCTDIRCDNPNARLPASRSSKAIVDGCEFPCICIVELQEAECFFSRSQWDQRNGFITFSVYSGFGVRACRSSSLVDARRSLVLFVQKLPCSVKNGSAGSNRPRIIFPHMHSSTAFPVESLSKLTVFHRMRRASFRHAQILSWNSTGLEIWVIVALTQTYTYCFTA